MSTPSTQGSQRKTYALLLPIVLFAATGNVLLGKGMKQAGTVTNWTPGALGALLVRAFTNGWIWLGIASLLLFLVSFMIVLSWADYSFVMPAASSSYALAALLGHWLLNESVTPERWAGVVLISLGVVLISRTPHTSSKTGPIPE
jgi:uncharacterized membrane protein